MIARRVAQFGLVALAIGCAQPAPPPAKPDAAAVKAGIAAYWAKYIPLDTSGNVAAGAAMLTSDFAMDASGGPSVRGRAAYTAMATDMAKTVKNTSLAINASSDWADGDHWYEQGTYSEGHLERGKPAKTEYGRYLAMFQKDSAANLLLARIFVIADSTPVVKPAKAPSKMAASKAAPTKATAPAKKAPAKKSGR